MVARTHKQPRHWPRERRAVAQLLIPLAAALLLRLPLDGYFQQEETTLAPLLPADLRDRLLADHRALRADLVHAAAPTPQRDRLLATAQRLHDHVRWEERVAFAWLEANLLK